MELFDSDSDEEAELFAAGATTNAVIWYGQTRVVLCDKNMVQVRCKKASQGYMLRRHKAQDHIVKAAGKFNAARRPKLNIYTTHVEAYY